MPDYKKALGVAVRKAREDAHLTQAQLAEKLGFGLRTIGNIENYRSNPQMEVLFPLVRLLHIPADSIFYPQTADSDFSACVQLQQLAATCSEDEAVMLNAICRSALDVMRSKEKIPATLAE